MVFLAATKCLTRPEEAPVGIQWGSSNMIRIPPALYGAPSGAPFFISCHGVYKQS